MKPTLEFDWKCGNIEIRACPKHLARLYAGEPNATIDVVLWHKDANGKPYCFSIAYFVRGKEGYYLRFVGERPLLYVSEEYVPALWAGLKQAQDVLDRWFDDTDGGAEDGKCLISRDALIARHCAENCGCTRSECGFTYADDGCDCCTFVKEIENAPAVDAVEVVRCKDCRHADVKQGYEGLKCVWCNYMQAVNLGYGFCQNGDKMKGDATDASAEM